MPLDLLKIKQIILSCFILCKFGIQFPIYIKWNSSETFHPDFLKGFKNFKKIAPDTDLKLIYGGKLNQEREGIQITNIWNL